MNTETDKPPGNAFTQALGEFREGRSLDELSTALQQVVAAVKVTGRAGSITYTLKIKPASKGAGNALALEDNVKVKLPEPERDSGIFFATDNNGLSRENPHQKTLDLRVVKPAAAEPLRQATA
jgi:hypothetical protein